MFNIPESVTIDKPYPEIEGATASPATVKIIQQLYSSRHSEVVAILNYSYQHFVSDQVNKEIADILIKIGTVEMHHMDLLASAILDFGGNPIYADSQNNPLSGTWVNYLTNIVRILEFDIVEEEKAYEAYLLAAKAVENESLKALFERIALDEQRHAEILTDLLKQVRFWLGDN
ncbi:MAG: ferritin family protein [Clostridia bacterium]|nr:ferritin family protein [Clostridia bacterium]